MEGLIRKTLAAAAITDSGTHFLYLLPVSDSAWYESGIEVLQRAREEWVRVISQDGSYIMKFPISKLGEPQFVKVPFREYIVRAYSKRLISSLDDPLIKKLRGIR